MTRRHDVEFTVEGDVTRTDRDRDLPALHQDGRMLVYGSLTGEPIRVGEHPCFTLSGRRTLEVYWLGYWLPRPDDSGFYPSGTPAVAQLIDEIADLMREGVLVTSPGTKYPLDEIHTAVTEAESAGRNGKVLQAPGRPGKHYID
jgi:NADPH:quinone reductase-like Zn-dependent oxidoreductase